MVRMGRDGRADEGGVPKGRGRHFGTCRNGVAAAEERPGFFIFNSAGRTENEQSIQATTNYYGCVLILLAGLPDGEAQPARPELECLADAPEDPGATPPAASGHPE